MALLVSSVGQTAKYGKSMFLAEQFLTGMKGISFCLYGTPIMLKVLFKKPCFDL